ncbi:hypothetical protein D6774_01120 [Candidatus Woesearchaeota archaeon]|jgi:ABC-type polysaccharide/polyol phosphate export permease|nr:MAG: hypothetical protein D6774_01120 [Candidatus Woesearchaeota archaeon]
MAVDPLFVQGVLKIMDVFLSLVAGVLCIRLFLRNDDNVRPWTFLTFALLIFAFGEVMGTLDAFGFISFRDYLPAIELGVIIFFILAVIFKLKEKKGVVA